MSYLARFLRAAVGFRKTLLRRPTETGEPAKAGFYGVFLGTRSRLCRLRTELAGFGQKRPILPKGEPDPTEGPLWGPEGAFLDVKRGFLTAFVEILSVLFGRGIGSSRTRFRTCSGTPFDAGFGRKVRIYPLKSSKAVQKVARKRPESGLFCVLFVIIDAENVLFVTFLPGKVDSGGPTRRLRSGNVAGFSSFMTKRVRSQPLIKPT